MTQGDSDEEDELPVEMREMVNRVTGESGLDGSGLDGRRRPNKRRKILDAAGEGGSNMPQSTRVRGRGRSRGRGGQRGGKGKSVDVEGVFKEEGEDDGVGFGGDLIAGAAVLDGVVWKLGFDKVGKVFLSPCIDFCCNWQVARPPKL